MNQFLQVKECERYYYVDREIMILDIYAKLHLVKIKIIKSGQEIIIDASAISLEPIQEKTITINVLGGDFR